MQLRDWFKSGRAPLDAMFSTKKWAEMPRSQGLNPKLNPKPKTLTLLKLNHAPRRQMQLNYSQDLQDLGP